jgi:hypothetical protein
MSTDLELVTEKVLIGKVVVIDPLGTVTGEVTVATEVSELTSVTGAPDGDGAGPFRVIVPVDELPPWTVLGDRLSSRSCGLMVTVRTAVTATWFMVAVMTTFRSEAGVVVAMLKVAEVD